MQDSSPLLGGPLQATPLNGLILLQVQLTLLLQSAAGSPGGYVKSCPTIQKPLSSTAKALVYS